MHPLELFRNISSTVPAAAPFRLLLAVLLGGLIGLERELKHRPAGLRTNMFICFGSAMFTLLSYELSGGHEPTRRASGCRSTPISASPIRARRPAPRT